MRKQTRRLANAGNSKQNRFGKAKQNRHERAGSGSLVCSHFERNLGFSALGILGLLSLVALNPVAIRPVKAICETGTDCAEASKPLALAVVANPTISISMEPSVVIDTLPTSEGTFNKNSTKVRVGTNNTSGLKVMMNGLSGTDLVSTNLQDTTSKVATITTPSTASNFAKNSWGYYFGQNLVDENTTYKSVPQDETVIEDLTSPAEMTEYELTFGANVSTSLPAGTYTGEVVVSAIANPLAITTMQELIYMQDMTTEICAASGEVTPGGEVTKQLIDSRDGTKYWVAKMADQNCWMTQNLALNLREGQRLTAGDTDLHGKAEWTVPTSTEFAMPEKDSDDRTKYMYTMRSWNLGEVNERYRAAGNYYQYNAAAVGSAGEEMKSPESAMTDPAELVDVMDSICPKGWQMPLAGRNVPTGQPFARNKSFYNLVVAYGYPKEGYNNQGEARGRTPFLTGEHQDLFAAPFNFVMGGYVDISNGAVMGFGSLGYVWSGTLATYTSGTYDMGMAGEGYGSGFAPSYNDSRRFGENVRCVAR